jgi:hypothetical protein
LIGVGFGRLGGLFLFGIGFVKGHTPCLIWDYLLNGRITADFGRINLENDRIIPCFSRINLENGRFIPHLGRIIF